MGPNVSKDTNGRSAGYSADLHSRQPDWLSEQEQYLKDSAPHFNQHLSAPPRRNVLKLLCCSLAGFITFICLRRVNPFQCMKHEFEHRGPYAQNGITWTPCGDNIECGRFEVPLDHFNLSLGIASLALARYPATNKEGRIGSVLTNPGGPGGSGVSYIYRAGKRLSDLLEGKYDIVSWDPRGINGTTPRVECFPSQTELDLFYANTHQEILPDARNLSDPIDMAGFKAGLRLADARNEVLARLCEEHSGEALKHVGTATVVRDLVKLWDALEGGEKINFWGFSYGTVIGSYFVNMFPHRVGKVVIDGVVDPDLWANTHAHEWPKWDFADTEKDLENFFDACAAAGPERCALASRNSTARTIAKDIDDLITRLYERPLAVPKAKRPSVLTASMVKAHIFSYLYRPREWPSLASQLKSALLSNGTALVDAFLDPIELDTTKPVRTASAIDAVTCVDTPEFRDADSPKGHRDAVDALAEEMRLAQEQVTRHFGALEIDMCHHWKVREAERYTGPFNKTIDGTILVIGNTADPITPVQNARSVNEMLNEHSRLIIQDGSGHCSSAMTSLCTGKAVRSYFNEGVLPPNGLVCPTDEVLFPPVTTDDTALLWLTDSVKASVGDVEFLVTLRELGLVLESFVSSFKRPRRTAGII